MKDLKTHINESLIMSYDHEKLKERLKKKYKVIRFVDVKSKSKVRSFTMTVSEDEYWKIAEDQGFYSLLNFFGYYATETNRMKDLGEIDVRLEPVFGTKCTDLVYNECKGVVYHVTKKENLNDIWRKGLIPLEGKTYRLFTERVFFSCGKDIDEIINNIKDIINQLNVRDYVILEVDLKRHKYNVDFYYDPSEDDKHNYIYANAIMFPSYIEPYYSVEELETHLRKKEKAWRFLEAIAKRQNMLKY